MIISSADLAQLPVQQGLPWRGLSFSYYSLGLAIPFMATSLAINTFLGNFRLIQKYMKLIMVLSGLLLIGFGLILLTDNIPLLLSIAPDLGVEELITH